MRVTLTRVDGFNYLPRQPVHNVCIRTLVSYASFVSSSYGIRINADKTKRMVIHDDRQYAHRVPRS